MIQAARKRTKTLIKKLTSESWPFTATIVPTLSAANIFCLMAADDMEAAYRADSMAKEWYNTTLKDVYLDKHENPNRRYRPYDKEILSQQLQ